MSREDGKPVCDVIVYPQGYGSEYFHNYIVLPFYSLNDGYMFLKTVKESPSVGRVELRTANYV